VQRVADRAGHLGQADALILSSSLLLDFQRFLNHSADFFFFFLSGRRNEEVIGGRRWRQREDEPGEEVLAAVF
jgi:hypothetical protein